MGLPKTERRLLSFGLATKMADLFKHLHDSCTVANCTGQCEIENGWDCPWRWKVTIGRFHGEVVNE